MCKYIQMHGFIIFYLLVGKQRVALRLKLTLEIKFDLTFLNSFSGNSGRDLYRIHHEVHQVTN